jgi:hypothetical protein
MMIRFCWVFALTAVNLAAAAHAEDIPSGSLACTFERGSAGSYSAGVFTTNPPEPLAFEIGGIDLEAQTAQLRVSGKPVGKSLRVVRALNAFHLLEIAQDGFLNVTTVYDPDPGTGLRPAVHSRHFGLIGEPIYAQYAGFCAPK